MFPFLADATVNVLEYPGYAVGWVTLCLINAGLAQAKNRSGFWWFLISWLLGPIATFILVAFCEKLLEESLLRRGPTT